MTLAEFASKNRRFVAAHRGASGEAPENTFAAFKKAIACGASFVEADIQITKDKVPIVFHDDELGRTVAGTGLISEYTYDELRDLSAGVWFGNGYENEKIPLLSELIELIKGTAYLGLEVKPALDIESKIDCLIDTLRKYDFIEHTLFASFDYNALKKLKEMEPKCHISAVRIPGDRRLPSELRDEYGIEAFICSVEEINDAVVEDIHHSKIFWGTYGIDSEADFAIAYISGVNAFATNFPCKMSEMLEAIEKEEILSKR